MTKQTLRAREYKIQLGPLEPLPRPIVASTWKRLTFLYTTGERLLAARTLDDLVLHSEERTMLWHTLRERARTAGVYAAALPEVDLPAEVLAQLLGLTSGEQAAEPASTDW
jgi:hypothetical protein